jgi:hypothetical protein
VATLFTDSGQSREWQEKDGLIHYFADWSFRVYASEHLLFKLVCASKAKLSKEKQLRQRARRGTGEARHIQERGNEGGYRGGKGERQEARCKRQEQRQGIGQGEKQERRGRGKRGKERARGKGLGGKRQGKRDRVCDSIVIAY